MTFHFPLIFLAAFAAFLIFVATLPDGRRRPDREIKCLEAGGIYISSNCFRKDALIDLVRPKSIR